MFALLSSSFFLAGFSQFSLRSLAARKMRQLGSGPVAKATEFGEVRRSEDDDVWRVTSAFLFTTTRVTVIRSRLARTVVVMM